MDERPLRVFVDTNVWVSALINPGGAPARVLDAFMRGRFVPVVSQHLLDELDAVLHRPRIRDRWRITEADVATVLSLVRVRGVEVVPAGSLHVCRDPGDDLLLETAILGNARFAVSRDDDLKRDMSLIAHLRERGVEVVSVAEFLGRLGGGPG